MTSRIVAVRRLLLAALLLGIIGTGGELLLINHIEGWAQFIPVTLLALALLVLGLHLALPERLLATQVFQALMVLFVGAGILGVVFHYQGAMAFQLETDPSLTGTALFWKSVRQKAPPALAPGSMIGLGLIGLAYTECLRRTE